jgi:tetratricopeptide (TPR) repeat protein
VSGATPALFDLLEALTRRILAGLIVGRDTALTKLAAVTTSSLPALRAFLRGEQELRAGRDAQAAVAFREAADLDTAFALAQYRLAVTGSWVNVREAQTPIAWAETAARHSDRLTPLGRDLLTAYRAYRETRTNDAERLYRDVLEGHPDNVEAWLMLGETLFHYNPLRGRPPMEAWAPFQRALALDSNAHAMLHLARLAASEDRLGALDSLTRAYLARYPDAERAIEMRALRAAAHDDARERAAVAADVRRSDNIVAIGVLQAALLYAQRPDAAGELAAAFVPATGAADPVLVLGRRILSETGIVTGRWGPEPAARLLGGAADRDWLLETEALLASDPFFPVPLARVASLRDSIAARRPYHALNGVTQPTGLDLGSQMRTYLLGLLSERLGDSSAARRSAAELDAARGPGQAGPARDLARALRAEIARSSGDPAGALAQIESFPVGPITVQLAVSHWGVRERFLHAEVLHALGRDDEALRWYDSFLGPWDIPWIAAAHYRRGQIQAQLGHREHARFHYSRFVRLWKDCDPEFRPLVDQATRALAQLDAPAGTR